MMTNKVEVSAKSGMHFKFYSDDVEVTYYCSPVSGKEVVKVNGEIVSEAQNFKFSSTHEFEINAKGSPKIIIKFQLHHSHPYFSNRVALPPVRNRLVLPNNLAVAV